jgi:hypothetical protein
MDLFLLIRAYGFGENRSVPCFSTRDTALQAASLRGLILLCNTLSLFRAVRAVTGVPKKK